MADDGDFVHLQSVSWSNGVIKSEAIAGISKDGVVMSNVKPYGGGNAESEAFVIKTSSPKSIESRIISNSKVLANATVYTNGVREVIATDVADKENQGFPWIPPPKRSSTSDILKEKHNQNPPIRATQGVNPHVRRSISSVSWSDGGIKSEASAEISEDGVVMSNVKPYNGGNVESPEAFVIKTCLPKSIKARIVSNRKVLAVATVYTNGVREVIATEDDDKENQGLPKMPMLKRSVPSSILKAKQNQNPTVKASEVSSQDVPAPSHGVNPSLSQGENQAANEVEDLANYPPAINEPEDPHFDVEAVLDRIAVNLSSTLRPAYKLWPPSSSPSPDA